MEWKCNYYRGEDLDWYVDETPDLASKFFPRIRLLDSYSLAVL